MALALELPDRGFPVEAGGLLEELQASFSKPQAERYALLEGEAEPLFLKLVSQVVGYGSHDASI